MLLTLALNEVFDGFKKVDWEMRLFVPHIFYYKKANSALKNLKNPFIKIETYNAVELYSFACIEKFLYRNNLAIPSGINVLIAALCAMISFGHKKYIC